MYLIIKKILMVVIHFTLIITFVILISTPSYSQGISDEKSRDIEKLLNVSGISDQLVYMESDLLKVLSAKISSTYPKIPNEFWDEFNNIMVGKNEKEHLIQKIIPVYDQYMDHQTIKNLIQMFDNPFWEEWKKKMPIISKKAGKLGGDWIREMSGAKVVQERMEFLTEKYDLENLNKKNKLN